MAAIKLTADGLLTTEETDPAYEETRMETDISYEEEDALLSKERGEDAVAYEHCVTRNIRC